jgi:hypothetical protein
MRASVERHEPGRFLVAAQRVRDDDTAHHSRAQMGKVTLAMIEALRAARGQ